MPERGVVLRLEDILDAIQAIDAYLRDVDIVWETITRRLPQLRVAVQAMLDGLQEDQR